MPNEPCMQLVNIYICMQELAEYLDHLDDTRPLYNKRLYMDILNYNKGCRDIYIVNL